MLEASIESIRGQNWKVKEAQQIECKLENSSQRILLCASCWQGLKRTSKTLAKTRLLQKKVIMTAVWSVVGKIYFSFKIQVSKMRSLKKFCFAKS